MVLENKYFLTAIKGRGGAKNKAPPKIKKASDQPKPFEISNN
jgi:hypothetical protein